MDENTIANAQDVDVVAVTEVAPPQKRRGRPAGSKNAPKAAGKAARKNAAPALSGLAVVGGNLTALIGGIEVVWSGKSAPRASVGLLIDAQTAENVAAVLKTLPALTDAQTFTDTFPGLPVADIVTVANYLA